MAPGHMLRFVGGVATVTGVALLAAPGAMASALGALGRDAVAGSSDPVSMAFWMQLAFIRLFGTALAGLGMVLSWCYAHVPASHLPSLVKVTSGVLGLLTLIAGVQQIAIWTRPAGWILVGALLAMSMACAASARRASASPAV